MNYVITIVLNENDPGFTYEFDKGDPCLRFNLDPQDMHFHFGPGEDIIANLQKKVNFLLKDE